MNKLFKLYFLLTVLIMFVLSCSVSKDDFEMKEGDLLFQDTGTDEIDNAIKSVTATSLAKNYSHVGMAMQENGEWYVLEAITKTGVSQTSLKEFLNRNKNSNQKSLTTVARLDAYYEPYIKKAIAYGVERIKTPYDAVFLWDDSAYYCSELIYKMFSYQNIPIDSIPFDTHPMTFNDSTGNPLPSWKTYYEKLNHPIPEGVVGTNPNLMASSPHLEFIYDYASE